VEIQRGRQAGGQVVRCVPIGETYRRGCESCISSSARITGALAVGMNAVVSQFGIQLPGRTREGRVVVDEVAAVVGRVVALRVTLVVYANVC